MAIAITEASLLRLLQLSSVSLPVGGYAFSQGLEYAIDNQWVRNKTEVFHWLDVQLQQSIARVDLPLLRYCMQAASATETQKLLTLNELLLACRETKELRLNDVAMGQALLRLINHFQITNPFNKQADVSFVAVFALAANHWNINFDSAALGFTWSWLENQVAAATKLIPLGQTQAQELLGELQTAIPQAICFSHTLTEDEVGAGLPAVAIASALHETQYSRLFRS